MSHFQLDLVWGQLGLHPHRNHNTYQQSARVILGGSIRLQCQSSTKSILPTPPSSCPSGPHGLASHYHQYLYIMPSTPFLGVLLTLFLTTSAFTISRLPYQAHSFNDLDYARRLLLKGVKYFKFDVSLADRESCLHYSTWDSTKPCIKTEQYATEICCVAMRGDASSESHFLYPFNTTVEFLKLFKDFLMEHHASLDFLLVAIDFQFGFEFSNSLVETFVLGLAQLLNEYPKLQVGIGKDWILEFDRVCRGQAVTDQPCTTSRKTISDSRIFLQSSEQSPFDHRDVTDRFKNFNIFYKEIDRLCRDGFPTWMNKYPQFPLIFWEPSNQLQIRYALETLFSPKCKARHNRTIEGIAFACNIDPEMFQIFMKPTREVSLSFPLQWLPNSQNLFIPDVSGVLIARLVNVPKGGSRLVSFWKENFNGVQKNILSVFNSDTQTGLISREKALQIGEQLIEMRGIQDKILTFAVRTDSNQASSVGGKAVSLRIYSSELVQVGVSSISNYIASSSDGTTAYLLVTTSNPSILNIIATKDFSNNEMISIFAMSLSQVSEIKSMQVVRKAAKNDTIIIITGDNGKMTWVAQVKNDQLLQIKTILFGGNSQIELLENGNIAISLENSYCHSGLLLNNNAQNKCLLHKSPALEAMATLKSLVNVVRTDFSSLLGVLTSGQLITACNSKVDFTKMLNGEQVKLAAVWETLFVSSKYVPLRKQEMMGVLFSGGSNYAQKLTDKSGWLFASAKDI